MLPRPIIVTFVACIVNFAFWFVKAAVVHLDNSNFDTIINNADVVFVAFSADWCRFSQLLTPILEETSHKYSDNKKVVFGQVNCDRETDLAARFHINKYPTLKLFRFGQIAKREYRGSRSVESFSEYIDQQLKEVVNELENAGDFETKIDTEKRNVLACFKSKDVPEYNLLRSIAANLREDCHFHVGIGDSFQSLTADGKSSIKFRPPRSVEHHDYTGPLTDLNFMNDWITDKCIPLVREITFENAEELTEEGLPFLILFRKPEDEESLTKFTDAIIRQLYEQKKSVNFLVADGIKFAHPLHHLGKTARDLPLIAIDSFRHMYLFPEFKDLEVPGKLKQFIEDMHSGKLHREFHHGPDVTEETTPVTPAEVSSGQPEPGHEHKPEHDVFNIPEKPKTSPPLSVFKNLKPSKTRYTLKRDEL